MISLVEPDDISEIETLCQRAFYQMDYHLLPRNYRYSSEHIAQVLARGVASPDHVLTKYVRDGVVQGVMVVGLTDFNFYSVGQRTAYEIVWHGDPVLPPTQQLRVQMSLLNDMLHRVDADIFSLTLDEKHIKLLKLLDKYGFVSGTRTVIRRV